MPNRHGLFSGFLLAALLANPAPAAAPPTQTSVDRQGDPLPRGAIARLGTVRLRDRTPWLIFPPDGRTLLADRLWDIASGRSIPWMLDNAHLYQVRFLADGKTVVVVKRGGDPCLEWWRLGAKTPQRRVLLHPVSDPDRSGPIYWHLSRDGTVLFSSSAEGYVAQWDTVTGKPIRYFDRQITSREIALSHDAKQLFLPSRDGGIHVYCTTSGKQLRTLVPDDPKTASAEGGYRWPMVSPDGQLLVAIRNSVLYLWNLRTGKRFTRRVGNNVFGCFSPDSKWLAWVGDRAIYLMDSRTLKVIRVFAPYIPCWGGSTLAFSPDGKLLAQGQYHCITLWDVNTGKPLPHPVGHQGAVESLAFSSDGQHLASGGEDGTAIVWDLATQRILHTFTGHSPSIAGLAFSPDGKMLATGEGSRLYVHALQAKIRLFDLPSGRLLRRFHGHLAGIHTLRFSPDGTQLASAGNDARVRFWDVPGGKRLGQVRHLPEGRPIAFLADGKSLLIHQKDGECSVVSTTSFALLNRFRPEEKHVLSMSAVYLPNRRTSSGRAGQIVCFEYVPGRNFVSQIASYGVPDGESSQPATVLSGNSRSSETTVLSPDSTVLAVAVNRSSACIDLWDLKRGKRFASLVGKRNFISALAFSPDGRTLASGGSETTVVLWDIGRMYVEYALAEVFSAAEVRLLITQPARLIEKVQALLVRSAETDQAAPRLIKDLDADEFAVREKANAALAKFGVAAAFSLRPALKSKSLEVRVRVRRLLERLGKDALGSTFDPDHIGRSVTILAWLGSPDATKALEKLAKSYPATRAGKEAAQALRRLRPGRSSR